MIKKGDFVLTALVLLLALGLALAFFLPRGQTGNSVTLRVNGEVLGVYSLEQNQQIPVQTRGGYNLLVIEQGRVHMEQADCPDGYCIFQGSISRAGQTLVCLPHRLIAQINGPAENIYDEIAG
jgi:hypothetical protein